MRKSVTRSTRATRLFRPSIRLGKHGRPMRDPEGHESNAGADNSGGNNQPNGNESSGNNNGGQSFDLTRFWDASGEGNESSPNNSGSAGNSNQSSGAPQNQEQQQQQPNLMQRIQEMNFGSNVMTEQAITQLAEGNTEAFHNGLNDFGRQVMQNTLREVVGILGPLRDSIYETVRNEMGQNFKQREDSADLLAAIPSAANPAVRPMVDSIFNRAMTLTKNDRSAAIQMTKDMLKLTATTTGGDIGLPAPNANDSNGLPQPSNVNWLEELSGRS